MGKTTEGHRGLLLALRDDGLEGIVLAATESEDPEDGVRWGRLYLVREHDPTKWPVVVEEVAGVPSNDRWMLLTLVSPVGRARSAYKYDVCLSFAGEDREYVERVARALASKGVRVFYDRYEEVELWGTNLYEHLIDIYQKQAEYCVMFISKHYETKVWTKHEHRAAQARALVESREYVLPARFDDTEVPGLLPTVGHLDLRSREPDDFAREIMVKLGRYPA